MDTTAQVMCQISLFKGLPIAEIEALAKHGRLLRFAANEVILGQNDSTNDVFFINCGRVRVTAYSASGRAVSYRDLRAGQMFGELSAIDGKTRSATVIALEDASMVRLSATAFRAALRHPEVANAMLGRLVNLVRSLSDRVFEFSTLSVRHRLHAELLRLAREEGINNNGRVTIAQSPKHAELADRLSTHREAVSREMSALTRARIIERSNDALVIRDLDRLTQLLADEMEG